MVALHEFRKLSSLPSIRVRVREYCSPPAKPTSQSNFKQGSLGWFESKHGVSVPERGMNAARGFRSKKRKEGSSMNIYVGNLAYAVTDEDLA
ncbi:MAG: hypothetical protein PHI85_10485, partial [Victivallaceae bacterium]|nr:hypothetical protein [Victivallaceae bacterium]